MRFRAMPTTYLVSENDRRYAFSVGIRQVNAAAHEAQRWFGEIDAPAILPRERSRTISAAAEQCVGRPH